MTTRPTRTTRTPTTTARTTASKGARAPIDADGDGTIDALDPDLVPVDTDDDGLTDDEEGDLGTDPLDPDTDDDGLTDGDEVNVQGTDPLKPDTDDGGIPDGEEVDQGTNPLDAADDLVSQPGRYLGGACDCDHTSGPSGAWVVFTLGLVLARRTARQRPTPQTRR